MGISGILFNPKGRISQAEFWRGLIILVGLSIVLTVISVYSPVTIASIVGFVSLLLIYPIICVYGKRLHDNGRTAWLVLVVLLVYVVISLILTSVLTPVLAPEFAAFQADLQEKIQNGEVGFVEAMELGQEQASGTLVLSIVVTLVASLTTGFFVARLESDPDENEHGLPTSGAASDPFS